MRCANQSIAKRESKPGRKRPAGRGAPQGARAALGSGSAQGTIDSADPAGATAITATAHQRLAEIADLHVEGDTLLPSRRDGDTCKRPGVSCDVMRRGTVLFGAGDLHLVHIVTSCDVYLMVAGLCSVKVGSAAAQFSPFTSILHRAGGSGT